MIVVIGTEVDIENFKNKMCDDIKISSLLIKEIKSIEFLSKYKDYKIFLVTDDVYIIHLLEKAQMSYFPAYRYNKLDMYNPLQRLTNLKSNQTILMGMSHSQCGIDETLVDKNILKICAPSLDLFLQYSLLKKGIEESLINSKNVEKVIIELPYYIFNYDLSKFGNYVYTKINYYSIIDDFSKIKILNEDLETFKNLKKIFKEVVIPDANNKISDNRFWINKLYSNCFKPIVNNDKVWNCLYDETIKMNKIYFSKIVNMCQTYLCSDIYILVMPFNPLFRYTHKSVIERQKKIFYREIKAFSVEVIDFFDEFRSPLMFIDHCHLGGIGVKKFSQIFEKKMRK